LLHPISWILQPKALQIYYSTNVEIVFIPANKSSYSFLLWSVDGNQGLWSTHTTSLCTQKLAWNHGDHNQAISTCYSGDCLHPISLPVDSISGFPTHCSWKRSSWKTQSIYLTVFLYQKGGDFQSMTFNVHLDIPFANVTLLNKKYQWIYQQHLAVWLVNSRGYHVPPSVYPFQAPKIQGAPVAIKGIAIGRSLWTQVLDLAQHAFMCWCLLIMWCGKWVVDVLVSSGKMTTLHDFFRLVMTRSCQLPYDFEDSGVL